MLRPGGARGCPPRRGRPPKDRLLTGIGQAQAAQSPGVFGYLAACWPVALLVIHLGERLHLSVGATTLRQAEATRAHLAEALADPRATVLAEDGCEVHLLPVLRAMWQRVGQQVRLATPGTNAKPGVFGALDLRTGAWHDTLTRRKRAVEFLAFLQGLLEAYPCGRVYVMVDSTAIHTSRAVRTWVDQHPSLELVYLPNCSGHLLNPVEKVWWALKGRIAANRSFRSLTELDRAIARYFAAFTPEVALCLTHSDLTRAAQVAAKSDEYLLSRCLFTLQALTLTRPGLLPHPPANRPGSLR